MRKAKQLEANFEELLESKVLSLVRHIPRCSLFAKKKRESCNKKTGSLLAVEQPINIQQIQDTRFTV